MNQPWERHMDRPRVTLCGIARRALHGLQLWFFFPRCHWCGDRTSSIEAHMRLQHGGDWIEHKR